MAVNIVHNKKSNKQIDINCLIKFKTINTFAITVKLLNLLAKTIEESFIYYYILLS